MDSAKKTRGADLNCPHPSYPKKYRLFKYMISKSCQLRASEKFLFLFGVFLRLFFRFTAGYTFHLV